MLMNAFMPIIFELLVIVMKWFFIAKDSGAWCNCFKKKDERYYTTKKKQIYEFIDLYGGPEYIMHFKFSNILNVTYVTMVYGLGLPLLFPIALLSYFIFWAVERYMLAYVYRKPPNMDEAMIKNGMKMLRFIPFMFLFTSYWMVGNR